MANLSYITQEFLYTEGDSFSYPSGVAVSGNYAYVLCQQRNSLSVLNITDPTNPSPVTEFVDETNLPSPYCIAISGNYAFITCYYNDWVTAIDISDPSNPSFASKVETTTDPGRFTDTMGAPWGIAISGNYAYVACNVSYSLAVINISNPLSMSIDGYTYGPTPDTSLRGAVGVAVSGNYAYVTCWSYFPDRNSLAIINISTPSSPTFTGEVIDNTYLAGPVGVAVSGNYAYIACYERHSLAVVNVSTPASPTRVREERGPSAGITLMGAWWLVISGTNLYMTCNLNCSVALFDISTPTTSSYVEDVQDNSLVNSPEGIALAGQYLYVGCTYNPAMVVIKSTLESGGGDPDPDTPLYGYGYGYEYNIDYFLGAAKVFAGTEDGIYVSSDNGAHYTRVFDFTGTSYDIVYNFEKDGNNVLYAATNNGILKKSTVNDTDWTLEPLIGSSDYLDKNRILGQSIKII